MAQALEIGVNEAFVRISTCARGKNRKLTDIAYAIVNDRSALLSLS